MKQIRIMYKYKNILGIEYIHLCKTTLVRSNVSGWHQIEEDIIKLYRYLVDLGMEFQNGRVYLADLAEIDSMPP